jgi:outer membrane protein OmpA-like peptidoglycan-associated protein
VRAPVILGLALICGAPHLGAQRAHQFEFGAFGSVTRYDRAFRLENDIGGGARLGYFFTNTVGAELDAGYQSPNAKRGGVSPTLALGSASLVLNFGGASHLFYILAGYSRLDFEKSAPYRFTDNAAHGAIGERLFLGKWGALRLEVRAIYAPTTGFAGGDWAGHVVGSFGLSVFTRSGPPLDLDRDAVTDKRDACPNTPPGATVDPRGCPSDTDGDGVFDGPDECGNTPARATVDARGCPSDADRDGVPDGLDRCPSTSAGAHVDAQGCLTDEDGDRVADGIDRCPSTPVGATVDPTGCTLDADNDGVPDGQDKCPSTAPGMEVDSVGCQRFRDLDGDSVDDTKDRCPDTPPDTRVDATGCLILFTAERTPVILRGVTFETGNSALRTESFTVLDIVAQSLIANPDIRLEIAGYTDNTGSSAVNQRLSQARADVVRAYLVTRGVAPDRMTAKGYGPSDPIAPNTTREGRAQNRRVELHQLP